MYNTNNRYNAYNSSSSNNSNNSNNMNNNGKPTTQNDELEPTELEEPQETSSEENADDESGQEEEKKKISTKTKVILLVILIAIIVLGLFRYWQDQEPETRAPLADSNYSIPLSGDLSDLGVAIENVPSDLVVGVVVSYTEDVSEGFGWDKNGEGVSVARWRLEQAGTNITLGVVSDNGTEDGARAAVSQLVEDGAGAIIALTSGDHTKALAEEAAKSGIPVIFPYEPWFETQANAYFYNPSHQNTTKTMIQHAQTLGCNNTFLISDDDLFAAYVALAADEVESEVSSAKSEEDSEESSEETTSEEAATGEEATTNEEENGEASAEASTEENTGGETEETVDGSVSGSEFTVLGSYVIPSDNERSENGTEELMEFIAENLSSLVSQSDLQCVMIDAAGVDVANLVTEMRNSGVEVPVIATGGVLNYSFSEGMFGSYSLLGEVYSVGVADNVSLAAQSSLLGDKAGVFNYAMKLMQNGAASLSVDGEFIYYGDYADLASHDALIAIVQAAANAGDSSSEAIASALSELVLDPESSVVSERLDFSDKDQPVRSSYIIQAAVASSENTSGEIGQRITWTTTNQQ